MTKKEQWKSYVKRPENVFTLIIVVSSISLLWFEDPEKSIFVATSKFLSVVVLIVFIFVAPVLSGLYAYLATRVWLNNKFRGRYVLEVNNKDYKKLLSFYVLVTVLCFIFYRFVPVYPDKRVDILIASFYLMPIVYSIAGAILGAVVYLRTRY